jgi:hypothetical protein
MSISSVTSEALQLKLRQLLPSQQGFGTDLSASDTIIPIIDLTASAEGSDVREDLQTAIAFGSSTAFDAQGATVTIANTAGFFKIQGISNLRTTNNRETNTIDISDGSTSKMLFDHTCADSDGQYIDSATFEFVVFLRTGDSITATTDSSNNSLNGSVRQIADVNGTLVQPVGFTPQ